MRRPRRSFLSHTAGLRAFTAVVAATTWLLALPSHGVSPLLREIEATYVQLGREVLPSVVNIDVTSRREGSARTPGGRIPDDIYRFFGITPDELPERMPTQGSGFIYDANGHIITNSHVVANAETIQVRLHDGREFPATVVGTDEATDLAVIKIEPQGGDSLTVAALGNSDSLQVGQFAVAIGSPRGLQGSMSFGHISALGREGLNLPGLDFQRFIQTDAAINLGNSGGPLCDINGRVIGINTAIMTNANAIGFAIPINMAKRVVPMLIESGRVARGFLGVNISDAADFAQAEGMPFEDGAFVENVEPNSPAARAGVRVYDVIRKVGEVDISDATHLRDTISEFPPEAEVVLQVWRAGTNVIMTARLGDRAGGGDAAAVDARNLLGMRVQELSPEVRTRLELPDTLEGVVVSEVEPDGPAFEAGIRPGTVVLDVAKKPVPSVDAYRQVVADAVNPGTKVLVRIQVRGTSGRVLILEVPDEP